MSSFGYTTGTGANTFLASQWSSGFINATGADIYVNQIRLLNITSARSGSFQCAIYSDVGGFPGSLIGVTDILTSLALGSNTFPVSGDLINVVDGALVHLCFRNNVSISMSSVVSSANLYQSSVPGSSAFAKTFTLSSGNQSFVLPLIADGSSTPPGTSDEVSGLVVREETSEGYPNINSGLIIREENSEGNPQIKSNLVVREESSEGYPNIKANLVVNEYLQPVMPELPVSTDPFPGFGNSLINPTLPAAADPFFTALPGLTFSVHKKPGFKTNIKEAASGREVRNALAQYPRWDFELTYEFLEDRSGADSSLKTIMGFFLARQGSFDSWLFKDPDDYLVVNGFCGNADGLITQFPFCRTMGSFHEKVGQVDESNTITLYLSIEEGGTVPSMSVYSITVAEAASFVEDLGVTHLGTPLIKAVGAPTAGHYSVIDGVYLFNAAQASQAMIISYRYEIDDADYTVTLPNLIVFDSAPPEGTLTGDFQFFFACRFLEDSMDFEKFYDKLWNLQECDFRSIIQ